MLDYFPYLEISHPRYPKASQCPFVFWICQVDRFCFLHVYKLIRWSKYLFRMSTVKETFRLCVISLYYWKCIQQAPNNLPYQAFPLLEFPSGGSLQNWFIERWGKEGEGEESYHHTIKKKRCLNIVMQSVTEPTTSKSTCLEYKRKTGSLLDEGNN